MRKPVYRAVIGASFLFLGACGGGGGGSHPQPTPTPTPTPTPAASSFPLTASASFGTISATRSYTQQPDGTLNGQNTVQPRPSDLSISYNADQGTYRVSATDLTLTYTAADRTSTSGSLDVYVKQGSVSNDQLKLYNNVRSGTSQSGAVQLTYLSYGIWSRTDPDTNARRKSYFLFGYPTATMPVTGTASYNTDVTASMVEGGPGFAADETELSGSATFLADFGAGTVSTDLTLKRPLGATVGTFNGTGTIAADQFSGTFASATPNFQNGSFTGGFFGPSAQEMGYVFAINEHNPAPTAGGTVAPMDTFITGLVVGTKK